MKKSLPFLLLILGTGTCFSQTTIDFETPGAGANYTWNAYSGSEIYPDVNNPSAVAPNTSDKVCSFVSYPASSGGAAHALALTASISPITFNNSNCIVKLQIYKPVISNVILKFDDNGTYEHEVPVANTVTNAWQELTFDFSSEIGKTFTRLILIPDYTPNRPAAVLSSFDNISFNDISTLPITLTAFNASLINEGVQLKWKTASEIDFKGFDVERSVDGKTFSSLAFVSSGKGEYTFTDNSYPPNTTLYYRLKQLDKNGDFEYSSVKAVKTNLAETSRMSVYPNPSNTELFLNYNSSGLNPTVFMITNTAGKVIEKLSNASKAGDNIFKINTQNLKPGVYFIQVIDDHINKGTYKFIKQ